MWKRRLSLYILFISKSILVVFWFKKDVMCTKKKPFLKRSYSSTSIYRDLKIKYPLFTTTNDRPTLSLLPNEQIYEVYLGISNVSSETGNLGAFHVTNIRLVWHSQLNVAFNASIPWIQIVSVLVVDSSLRY